MTLYAAWDDCELDDDDPNDEYNLDYTFGCCLPPGECCMPGIHMRCECHTAADYERARRSNGGEPETPNVDMGQLPSGSDAA